MPDSTAHDRETIFAPTTAPGRAAVAIVRLSGPACRDVCQRLTRRPPPPARRASLREISDPADGEALDVGLILWCPGPQSLSGEDVLELQLHGGRGVVAGVLEALARLPGLRPAEPGEFSRRAFLNGRLDLTGAEGLADLVAAETRLQARQALRQLGGELGRLYAGWRETLIGVLARLEAEIDFASEEEVPEGMVAAVRPDVQRLSAEIAAHLADDRRGERLRAGLTVAVVGPPNAGKSSLVNHLAGRDVAIVAARPGTTRDVLEVPMDLAGLPVTVLDTAGLREVADEVEAEGVRRARQSAEQADLRVVLLDGELWPEFGEGTAALLEAAAIVAVNKADLETVPLTPRVAGREAIPISCRTGQNVSRLLDRLGDAAREQCGSGETPLLTRARHRSALKEAAEALARFLDSTEGGEVALLAEDLRLASRALGRITGQVAVDDVLDRIFGEFCIGK